jgi:hypothetical protein
MAKPTGDILTGMGEFVLESLGLPADILLNMEPIEFSIEPSINKVESKKFKLGKKVRAGTAINESSHTCKMSVEAIHWQIVELAFGYRSTTETVAWPTRKEAVADASGNIVDLDITSSNLMVVVQDSTGEYIPLQSGAGGYTVSVGTNTLGVGLTYAGKNVIYRILKPLTGVKALGYSATADEFSAFKFNGVGYMGHAKVGISIEKMALANEPTINPADVTKLDFEFDLIPVGSAPKGFKLVQIEY